MVDADKRRDERVPIQLPIVIKDSCGESSCLTHNINRRGIYIRMDNPKPLRQLIQFRISLPPTDQDLDLIGMVVHSVTAADAPEQGVPPGMGIQLYGLGGSVKQQWETYVAARRKEYMRKRPTGSWMRPVDSIDAVQRKHPRQLASFRVIIKDVEKLYEFLSKDVSLGGMFLRSDVLFREGTQVELIVVHPLSDEEFPVGGVVVRVEEEPLDERGMGIEFTEFNTERLGEFESFIESGIPFEELDDIIVVEIDDPKLAE